MKTWCSEGVRTGPRSEELAGPEELAGRRNWRSRRNWRGRGPGQAGTAIHPLLGNRESSHKARVQEPPRSTGAARRSGTARQLRCERFPERGRRLFTRIAHQEGNAGVHTGTAARQGRERSTGTAWTAGLRPASRGSAKSASMTPRHPNVSSAPSPNPGWRDWASLPRPGAPPPHTGTLCGSLFAVSETQRPLLITREPQDRLWITFR